MNKLSKSDKVLIAISICIITSMTFYVVCKHFGVPVTGKEIIACNCISALPFLPYPTCAITLILSLIDGTFSQYVFWCTFQMINHLIIYKMCCGSFKEEYKLFDRISKRPGDGPDDTSKKS